MPYEIATYERDAATCLAPAALKAVHPLGKSPVLTDGDRTIAESGAIVDYVVRRYGDGRLQPDLLGNRKKFEGARMSDKFRLRQPGR